MLIAPPFTFETVPSSTSGRRSHRCGNVGSFPANGPGSKPAWSQSHFLLIGNRQTDRWWGLAPAGIELRSRQIGRGEQFRRGRRIGA
jgi:hypothetical protein